MYVCNVNISPDYKILQIKCQSLLFRVPEVINIVDDVNEHYLCLMVLLVYTVTVYLYTLW